LGEKIIDTGHLSDHISGHLNNKISVDRKICIRFIVNTCTLVLFGLNTKQERNYEIITLSTFIWFVLNF